jgi:hypothetical protein
MSRSQPRASWSRLGTPGSGPNSRSLAWLREASSLSRRIFRAGRIEVGQMNAGPAFTTTCACLYGSAAFTPVKTRETRFLSKNGSAPLTRRGRRRSAFDLSQSLPGETRHVGVKANMEKTNDPVDRCFCLRISFRNLGPSNVASAALSDGRHYHAGRSRVRSWHDTSWRCLRCQSHQTPGPQASPQVRGVGRRERLRSVVLSRSIVARRVAKCAESGKAH